MRMEPLFNELNARIDTDFDRHFEKTAAAARSMARWNALVVITFFGLLGFIAYLAFEFIRHG